MAQALNEPELQPELIRELRSLAARGATVRQMTQVILNRLEAPPDAIIPVLGYFCRAFDVRLRAMLPIREWLGTDNDAEIDALILPEIAATRDQWMAADASGNGAGDAGGSIQERDQATMKK